MNSTRNYYHRMLVQIITNYHDTPDVTQVGPGRLSQHNKKHNG